MQSEFNLYKVDMKYIRNLHKIDDKVLSVSPQTGKENRVFVGIVVICGGHKYCIPLSSPKRKHQKMRNSMDFSKIEVNGKLLGVLNFNLMIPIEEHNYNWLIQKFINVIEQRLQYINDYVSKSLNGARKIAKSFVIKQMYCIKNMYRVRNLQGGNGA